MDSVALPVPRSFNTAVPANQNYWNQLSCEITESKWGCWLRWNPFDIAGSPEQRTSLANHCVSNSSLVWKSTKGLAKWSYRAHTHKKRGNTLTDQSVPASNYAKRIESRAENAISWNKAGVEQKCAQDHDPDHKNLIKLSASGPDLEFCQKPDQNPDRIPFFTLL